MKISDFGRYVLGICAAVVVLAGCGGGSQSQLAPSAPFQQSSAQSRLGQLPEGLVNTVMSGAAMGGLVAMHPDHGPSWMAPEAKAQNLLYLTNYGANNVLVFSYPQDKLVGTLTGLFNLPDGDCTDKKGDVWIVNQLFEGIVEYKHGGTNPIATLQDPGYYAGQCVVDPTTGNLIVTNNSTYSGSGPGNVAIYTHAKGSAKLYSVAGMYSVFFCAFDDKGNLYVDGLTSGGAGFQLAELPKGKKTFTDIPLKGGTIYFPGNIQWAGKYMAVGDQEYLDKYPHTSAIYQTTGAGGKIVGVTRLKGSIDVIGFRIDGTTVIGPEGGTNLVPFYKYPAGGSPIKILKNKAFDGPWVAAISLAK
jgi:hypothetical protein